MVYTCAVRVKSVQEFVKFLGRFLIRTYGILLRPASSSVQEAMGYGVRRLLPNVLQFGECAALLFTGFTPQKARIAVL